MTDTMRVAEITAPGAISLVERERPHGFGDVVVVRADVIPLCTEHKDRAKGLRSDTIGHELAGVVVDAADSTRVRVGDRVVAMPGSWCGACEQCRAGESMYCRAPRDLLAESGQTAGLGTIGEAILKPDWLLVPVPDDIDLRLASSMCCLLGPAFNAAMRTKIDAADRVLVAGCGPVGLGSLVVAKTRGAQLFALETHPYRVAVAERLGAQVFDPRDPDVADALLDASGGGVTVSVETSGAPTSPTLLAAASAPRARMALVAWGAPLSLPPLPPLGLDISACWHWRHTVWTPAMITTVRDAAGRGAGAHRPAVRRGARRLAHPDRPRSRHHALLRPDRRQRCHGSPGHRTLRQGAAAGRRGQEHAVKLAIIGVSGPRAEGHAAALRHVEGVELVGVSARTPGAAAEFARRYGDPRAYLDHRDMITSESPELVVINTPPNVRLELLQDCAAAGVRALVIEKPVAIDRSDLAELDAFARTTRLPVVVNHQLHFHRPVQQILEHARNDLGELLAIDASAGLNAAYQGTHLMELARSVDDSAVTRVSATAVGATGLQPNQAQHFAPDHLDARYRLTSGVELRLRAGAQAPRVDGPHAEAPWSHKRLRVEGAHGQVEWTMWSWQVQIDGERSSGPVDYGVADEQAQAALIESVRAIVTGEASAPHPLRLERAVEQCGLLFDAYQSAVDGHPVDPGGDGEDVLPRLRHR